MSSKRQQRFLSAQSPSTAELDLSNDDVVSVERVPIQAKETRVRPAQSIACSTSMIEAAAEGAEWAIAIRDAWRRNLPVRTVSQSEWDRMVANNVVF